MEQKDQGEIHVAITFMRMLLTITVCCGLTIVFSSCDRKVVKNASANELKEYMLMNEIGDALTDKVLLTEIRQGHITNAINMLEYSVDCSVLALTHSTNYDLARQQQVRQTLHLLKEYRLKYPREIQTNAITDDETKGVVETAKKAEEILGKVK